MPETALSKEEIEREVRRLAPFHHDMALPYGLRTHVPELSKRKLERLRLAGLVGHLWPTLLELCGGSLSGMRVLDVGCNAGGFAFEAARSGADFVLGVDVVDRYIEQANFVKRVRGDDRVEFRVLGIEGLDPEELGTFDVSFCFGLLYHLEDPVSAMRKLGSVTDRIMVVDTGLDMARPETPYWRMDVESKETDPVDALESTALWRSDIICELVPSAAAVEKLLGFIGFASVHRLPARSHPERRYRRGKRATFVATRERSELKGQVAVD